MCLYITDRETCFMNDYSPRFINEMNSLTPHADKKPHMQTNGVVKGPHR